MKVLGADSEDAKGWLVKVAVNVKSPRREQQEQARQSSRPRPRSLRRWGAIMWPVRTG